MLEIVPLQLLMIALLITFGAGLVKGTVGFAMPMVMISGMSTFLAPDLALAALIVPTLMANGWQALRQGLGPALHSLRTFRVYLLFGLVFMLTSAQLVSVLSQSTLFLMIGAPVAAFALMQLVGWRPKLAQRSMRIEAAVGSFAGFMGGMSGVWGPPTVAYLTAIETPKAEQMRVQGTIYGLGAVALLGAHIQSGVLRADTLPLSVAMVVPALAGMFLGLKIQDRIDQQMFRKATLFVLLIAGLNLMRRGLVG